MRRPPQPTVDETFAETVELRVALGMALRETSRGLATECLIERMTTMDGLDLADAGLMANAWRSPCHALD